MADEMARAERRAERQAASVLAACEERRRKLGLSYAELARRMGVSRAYVSKLMRGGAGLSLRSLSRLAAALEADVSISLAHGPARRSAAVIVRNTEGR